MKHTMKFSQEVTDMKQPVKEFITHAYILFGAKEEYDMDIKQVLSIKNQDGTKGYQAIAVSRSDPDEIRCIRENIPNELNYEVIPEWDYNIDDYLLADLETGYEIEHMELVEHHGIWHCIDGLREEITHTDGLQKYLCYCQQHEITPQTISLYSLEHIDITDLYQESNVKYKIIAETNIGHRSVVLGHIENKKSCQYVTWSTTPNRKYGYDDGHYFSSYTEAFKDYKKRCENILERHLDFERNKIKATKEKKYHER